MAVHVMKRKVIWKKKDIQMTSEKHFNLDGGLEVPGCWTTEVGREEQPLPTFDLQ